MDQLYTYQILQELKNKSWRDDWGFLIEILVQGIILWFTITFAVKLSKREFEENLKLKESEDIHNSRLILNHIEECLKKEVNIISEKIEHIETYQNSNVYDILSKRKYIERNQKYLEAIIKIDFVLILKSIKKSNSEIKSTIVSDFVTAIIEISDKSAEYYDFQKSYFNNNSELTQQFLQKFNYLISNIHKVGYIDEINILLQTFSKKGRNEKDNNLKIIIEFVENLYNIYLRNLKGFDEIVIEILSLKQALDNLIGEHENFVRTSEIYKMNFIVFKRYIEQIDFDE